MVLPFDDIRVVDLTTGAAGPYGTRVLADYGADVVKVEEPPAGDPARREPPFHHDEPGLEKSGLFLLLNTNKRGITLNLQTERGREILKELVRRADVLMESFAPGVMATLGLDYSSLSAVNPRLVMTSVTNFGQTGPYRDWEGTDLTLYAMGGNMYGSGDPELEPVKTAGRMASFHVGYAAALATSTALLAAEERGAGEHVDVSAFEVAMHSIDSRLGRLMGYQHTRQLFQRRSGASNPMLGSGNYPCADGYFQIHAGAVMFPKLAKMVGAEYLLELPEWSTMEARSRPEAIDEFDVILVPWLFEHTRKEIQALCLQYGVLGAPLNTIDAVLEDEHLNYRHYFQTIDHPATAPLPYPGYAVRLHTDEGLMPMPARRPAPLLGQHTVEVLGGLGYTAEETGRLRAQGVI